MIENRRENFLNKYQIHEFAVKWLEKYQDPKTIDREVEENFADECFAIGFEMDCGNSLEETFPGRNLLNDHIQFNAFVGQINDIKLLGAAIFSKWRGITHWSYCESLISESNRPWFIAAFERLALLTEVDGDRSFVLQGKAKKIQIKSNNVSYGPPPEPDEEVEQRLTLGYDGRVWFSGYNFAYDLDHYVRGRHMQFKLEKEKADTIFSAFSRFFGGEFDEVFATDIGTWEMTITNEEDRKFSFSGSLCAGYEIDGVDLSDLLREEIGIENLFVFDGNDKPDEVKRITIDYKRHSRIKTSAPVNEALDHIIWDYSEHIVIDRETEKLTYIQNVGSDCKITREYQVKDGIVDFLDNMDADSLFDYTEGNPEDAIENLDEEKSYVITVDFEKGPQRVRTGSFDKNGLPEDWPEFAEEIVSFINFYGQGEALNPAKYGKAKRRNGEFIFCSATFEKNGKDYYYLADADDYEVGDFVFVPSGSDGHTAIVRIVKIDYFAEENVPYPVAKVKHIIRKCSVDEI